MNKTGNQETHLPVELREILRAVEVLYGVVPRSFIEVVTPYADNPALGAAHVSMETALGLAHATDPNLRMLTTIKVALLLGCRVCAEGAAAFGRAQGIPAEQLVALVDHVKSSTFSSREKLVLDYATAVSLPPGLVPEALRDRLRAEFTREQLVEIAATIAMEHYRVRFRRALLEREDEEGTPAFCLIPSPARA